MEEIVELSVDNQLTIKRNREPVSTGVPLPRELNIEDTEKLALLDESGRKVPAQFQPLAWWTDQKTVKWVLVHFQANVPRKDSVKYILQYDSEADVNHSSPIAKVEQDRISVDTGELQCSIEKVSGIFTQFKVKKEGEWWNCSGADGTGPEMVLTTDDGKWRLGAPTAFVVEDNGRERSVLKLSGNYESMEAGGSHPSFSYEVRLEFYRGRADMKWTHTIIGQQTDGFAGLSLHVPLANAQYVLGYDQQDVHSFRSNVDDLGYSIVQESEDRWIQGELATGKKQEGNGRHDWWIRANTDEITVIATVKHFYQRYPKGLTGDFEGVHVNVLPHLSENKDSFVPANQMKDRYELREGEARTHEIGIAFYSPLEDEQTISHFSNAFHQPLQTLAPWSWYTESGALGELLPRSDSYPTYEQAVDESLAIYLGRRESLQLYGDRNYGDDQYTRPGDWNNGEYDYIHVGMLHFLRGAGVDWYEKLAMPYALHLMDIDVCHAGSHAGMIHQHNEWHNSKQPKLGSHAWIRGLLEYYCFSGDFRARDVARMVADRWSKEIIAKGVGEGTERGITWPVLSMLGMYDTFPEHKYYQAAKILIDTVLDCHDSEEGHFKGAMFRETTKDYWGTFVIGSPVLESLIMYYESTGDERAKEAVVNASRRLARLNFLEDIGAWEYTHSMLKGDKRAHNAKTDKMVSPAVLYGYLYSGDKDLLDKAKRAFRYSESIPAQNGKDLGQSYCFGIRIPALIEKGEKIDKQRM